MPDMNYQKKSAPLYVWGLTFFFVCVVVGFSLFLFRQSFVYSNIEKIRIFSTVTEKRIIALGSSLLGHATFPDEFMSDFGKANGFDDFKYLQITRGGGLQEDFIPFMHSITEAKPDIVVIESNLVLLDLDKSERLKLIERRHQKKLRHIGSQLIRWFFGAKQKNSQSTLKTIDQQTKQDSMFFVLRSEFTKNHFGVRDTILPKEIKDFFVRAKEKKIRVILVDIPRSERLEEVITRLPSYDQNVSYMIQALKTKYGVEYLKFPDQLGLEYYVDFAHFNQAGRERYSLWLLSCLSKY